MQTWFYRAMIVTGAAVALFTEGKAGVSIQKIDMDATSPEFRWLAAGGEAPALAAIRDEDGRPLAAILGGWSAHALRLTVEVADPKHVAARDARRLWAADSIEVGIDAGGEAESGADRRAAGDENDFRLIFGLMEEGPAAGVLTGKKRPEAAALAAAAKIERQEGADARTIYRLELPWELLGVKAGTRPHLGLGVQVNQFDRAEGEKRAYFWGEGMKGGLNPARLERLRLGAPPAGFAALEWLETDALDRGASNRLAVGMYSRGTTTVEIASGERTEAVDLPGGDGWRFFRLETAVAKDGDLLRAEAGTVAAAVEARQTVAEELKERLVSKAEAMGARDGTHRLFKRHLESIAALAAEEWTRLPAARETDPARVGASAGYFKDLLEGLEGEAGSWDAFLEGRRSLVIAYRSRHDGTVQYYMLGLPRDWDERRAYPMFFELHGSGNPHPLNGLAARLGAAAKTQALAGYETPKVYAEIDRAGFWVYPFGRGNSGYRGVGRIDVLEAYEDAHQLVKIDPDRRYLYGFSMGAGGTYNLAMRTPSRWAAASAFAPATGKDRAGGVLTPNLALVPLKLLCGEEDRFMRDYREIIEDCARYGILPEARSIPGLGHTYTGEGQKEMIEWLKTHTRRRPASFRFVADDDLTGECWGVRVGRPAGSKEAARIQVRIEGELVGLTSENVERLTLDFSAPDGLGLDGVVVVRWNGKEVYRGPAKTPLALACPM